MTYPVTTQSASPYPGAPATDPQFMRPVYAVVADIKAAVAGNPHLEVLVHELCVSLGKSL